MESDEDASEIVRAIVALARNLGIDVIAEGVETQAQCDALRDLDCKGQGYLFSRPLDADAARQFLAGSPIP
jgi:EAL domain-containing protein (putative c-di-GMP-specific phosphodiesterase class I)